ncbi:MAG: DUF2934 domain-containing protein [Candidatus Omnitrophica bacterium]|nr:DUF2934 domain-containing protein [Candidatus Omnitrophota bacterium]
MDRREEIKRLAESLYIRDGRKNDKTLDYWLKAERIVLRRQKILKYMIVAILLIGIMSWLFQQKI